MDFKKFLWKNLPQAAWDRAAKALDGSEPMTTTTTAQEDVGNPVKEHAVPPCLVLVIDDNLYGLMIVLSYT